MQRELGTGSKFLYAETGSFLGCSSILMASLLPNDALVYAHDIWVDSGSGETLRKEGDPPEMVENYFYHFYDNVRRRGLESTVIPVRGKSEFTLGIHQDNSLSMGFVDGDHSFEGVSADLNAIYPKIKPGGILLLHDVMASGVYNPVAEALKEFCTVRGLYCEMMLAGTEMARVWKPLQ